MSGPGKFEDAVDQKKYYRMVLRHHRVMQHCGEARRRARVYTSKTDSRKGSHGVCVPAKLTRGREAVTVPTWYERLGAKAA